MLVFIVNVFCLLKVSQAFSFPDPDVCIFEKEALSCFCKYRENITISANMNFDIKYVIVEGCGAVSVPLGALTHLMLSKISFIDIITLDILPFAFVGVQTVDTFRIENIQDFKVRQHGFAGLYNVTNFIIRNATASSLLMGSFDSVSNVQNLFIENSSFDEVQETAFIVTNISSFNVVNCRIRIFESISFLIHNSKEIVFENCVIHETSNNSITVSSVESLSFFSCHFGVIASNTITSKSLNVFNFKNCSVDELESDAFAFVDASEKVTFSHNIVRIAEEYSLFPSTGVYGSKDVYVDDCCNSFTCDCNIYWLWETNSGEPYKSLLESSFCIEKPETNLSVLEPILDSSNNCMTLELKIFNSKSKVKPSMNKTGRIKTASDKTYQVKASTSTCIKVRPENAVLFLVSFVWYILLVYTLCKPFG